MISVSSAIETKKKIQKVMLLEVTHTQLTQFLLIKSIIHLPQLAQMVNGLLGTRTQKQFIQKVRKVILVLLASNLVKTLVSWCIHMDMIGVLELSKALKYKIRFD